MKNLATLPKSKMTIKPVELHQTKSSRGKTKFAATINSTNVMTSTPAGKKVPRKRMMLRNCRNPFVHVKKLHLPAELIISKSFRAIRQGNASKSTLQQAPKAAKGANNNKTDKVKAKSKAALKKAKSNVINIVKLAQKNNSGRKVVSKAVVTTTTAPVQTSAAGETQRNVRKRKLPTDLNELEPLTRKSARISKDCSNEAPTAAPITAGKANAANSKKSMRKAGNKSDTLARFTPPLTRSRLKTMSHCKLLEALDYRRRII